MVAEQIDQSAEEISAERIIAPRQGGYMPSDLGELTVSPGNHFYMVKGRSWPNFVQVYIADGAAYVGRPPSSLRRLGLEQLAKDLPQRPILVEYEGKPLLAITKSPSGSIMMIPYKKNTLALPSLRI
ncbi:MAG TPA: hypothetical protein VFF28_01220 [Candidatus Nanoarchaeia archaeon]|nr:hypothetical protein [Candidatus Nanoarchaeia archaeon]